MTDLRKAAEMALISKEQLKTIKKAFKEFGYHHNDCPQYPTYSQPKNYPDCNCGFEKALAIVKSLKPQESKHD